MAQNIVKEVQDIENEADGILESARQKAREIEESVEPELEDYKRQQDRDLEDQIQSLKNETQQKMEDDLAEIKKRADAHMERLSRIDRESFEEAVEMAVEKISGK